MSIDSALDPLAVWICAALIATLFAHAAITKLVDLPLLEQHLAVYGVPFSWLSMTRWLLPAIELTAALLLLTPWRTLGALIACAALIVYAAAMGYHRMQRHELDCGCGGEPLPVSWALVARNLALAGLASVAAMPMVARAMGWRDFAVVVAALILATLLYAAFNQVLRHRASLGLRQNLGRTSWMH